MDAPAVVSDPATPGGAGRWAAHADAARCLGLLSRRRAAPRCAVWTCELTPGRRVALVGPSGAGKSTLADVLVRFLPADAGEATLDGYPLERLAADDVRRVVGLVEQSPHLFDTTLAENLRVGRRAATDAELDGVLDPRRPRPVVGGAARRPRHRCGPTGRRGSREDNANGSPSPAPCWPTSPSWCSTSPASTSILPAADALTADLLALTEGRSTLLITHRLTGLEQVDEIIVLDEGRVVERGTHGELVAGRRPLRRPVVGRADERPAPCSTRDPLRHEGTPGRPQRRERQPVSLDLARWQFGSTSIYHFLFVPITIGLAFLVALLETAWYRNGDDTYRRLARFFGSLLLINVAVGVVTGLIQEFEFGMNWSVYSRLVGNASVARWP